MHMESFHPPRDMHTPDGLPKGGAASKEAHLKITDGLEGGNHKKEEKKALAHFPTTA